MRSGSWSTPEDIIPSRSRPISASPAPPAAAARSPLLGVARGLVRVEAEEAPHDVAEPVGRAPSPERDGDDGAVDVDGVDTAGGEQAAGQLVDGSVALD